MKQKQLVLFILLLLIFFFSACHLLVEAQQGYSGDDGLDDDCDDMESTAAAPPRHRPQPSYLYTCNGESKHCKTFLVFVSTTDYASVSDISALMSVDPSELAHINGVPASAEFPPDKEVIVPVSCSCTGEYYQANTTFNSTSFSAAIDAFVGLSSCSSLVVENTRHRRQRHHLVVLLRCACPTKNQSTNGIEYLVTYPIFENDTIYALSNRFNTSYGNMFDANGFSEGGDDPVIYPRTTILIPLTTRPSSSQLVFHHPIAYPPSSGSANILPVVSADQFRRRRRHPNMVILESIAAGITTCLVVAAVLAIVRLHGKKRESIDRQTRIRGRVLAKHIVVDHDLKVFTMDELREATLGFERKLGGSVYKGVLRRSLVAIKEERNKDVSEEVCLLHKLNHFNVISLLGVCFVARDHCFLVYEYMEGGSLKDWLRSDGVWWSWKQRVQIALDVASGLDYLHNFTKPGYVHGGIRSSSILLDGNLRAKIASFSMAKASGMVTPKLDVFAFGVVLIELVTGKDAAAMFKRHHQEEDADDDDDDDDDEEGVKMENCFSMMKAAAMIVSASRINGVHGEEEEEEKVAMLAMAKLGLACLRREPKRRPSMNEAASVLSMILQDLLDKEDQMMNSLAPSPELIV